MLKLILNVDRCYSEDEDSLGGGFAGIIIWTMCSYARGPWEPFETLELHHSGTRYNAHYDENIE